MVLLVGWLDFLAGSAFYMDSLLVGWLAGWLAVYPGRLVG